MIYLNERTQDPIAHNTIEDSRQLFDGWINLEQDGMGKKAISQGKISTAKAVGEGYRYIAGTRKGQKWLSRYVLPTKHLSDLVTPFCCEADIGYFSLHRWEKDGLWHLIVTDRLSIASIHVCTVSDDVAAKLQKF